MDVDAVDQLTGFFSTFDDSTSSADTLMQDVMTLGTAASSSDNGHPQVDQLHLPNDGIMQPSGPIITPSVEVQPVIFTVSGTGSVPGPLFKQQATANEVLFDMTLIRTGMGLDSPLMQIHGGSDASASSSSSSSSSSSGPVLSFSSEEPSGEHSSYPGPSVEIVSNIM